MCHEIVLLHVLCDLMFLSFNLFLKLNLFHKPGIMDQSLSPKDMKVLSVHATSVKMVSWKIDPVLCFCLIHALLINKIIILIDSWY